MHGLRFMVLELIDNIFTKLQTYYHQLHVVPIVKLMLQGPLFVYIHNNQLIWLHINKRM